VRVAGSLLLLCGLAGTGEPWECAPLMPGAEMVAPAGGGVFELRYRALWDVELRVTAAGAAGGILLELLDAGGSSIARAGPGEGETGVAAELDAGEMVLLRLEAPAGGGAVALAAIETPPVEEGVASLCVRLCRGEGGESGPLDPAIASARARAHDRRAGEAEEAGDLEGSEAGYRRALFEFARGGDFTDPNLATVVTELAQVRWRLGNELNAVEELLDALGLAERLQGPDHPNVLRLWLCLARALGDREEHASAVAILERKLPLFDERLPPDDSARLAARGDLAHALVQVGGLARARSIAEADVADLAARLPPLSDAMLRARAQLLRVLVAAGDTRGAIAVQEQIVAALEAARSPDDPDLLGDRVTLAQLLNDAGELERARALAEPAIARLRAGGRRAQGSLRVALSALAATEKLGGDRERALVLFEEALRLKEATGVRDKEWASLRMNYAASLGDSGELERELALEEETLAFLAAHSEPGEIVRVEGRANLAITLHVLGLAARRDAALRELAGEIEAVVAANPGRSWREARELAAVLEQGVVTLLELGAGGGDDLGRLVFETSETVRALASGAAAIDRRRDDPELADARGRLAAARRAVERIGLALAGAPRTESERELAEAARTRDAAEFALRERLLQEGAPSPFVRLGELQAALPADGAAISLRRYSLRSRASTPAEVLARDERLVAHVALPRGPVARLDLGMLAPIEETHRRWRAAVAAKDGAAARTAGAELAGRLIDPLRQTCPGARRIALCVDDALELLPFDALPSGDRGVVGDELSVRLLPSLLGLSRRDPPAPAAASLLAVGAVDYGTAAGGAARFPPLPGTAAEIAAVARLFRSAHDRDAVVRTGAAATVGEIARLAPGARVLHLATHGWIEEPPAASASTRRLLALAPLTLCGVALAGANGRPHDEGGPAGLLTAEQIAGLELDGCELAVLSACETGGAGGERHAGLGLQSLRAALHAAGARAVIASAWPVDDLATAELMRELYRALWVGRLAPNEALARARKQLRDAGEPPAHWAGWILSTTGGS